MHSNFMPSHLYMPNGPIRTIKDTLSEKLTIMRANNVAAIVCQAVEILMGKIIHSYALGESDDSLVKIASMLTGDEEFDFLYVCKVFSGSFGYKLSSLSEKQFLTGFRKYLFDKEFRLPDNSSLGNEVLEDDSLILNPDSPYPVTLFRRLGLRHVFLKDKNATDLFIEYAKDIFPYQAEIDEKTLACLFNASMKMNNPSTILFALGRFLYDKNEFYHEALYHRDLSPAAENFFESALKQNEWKEDQYEEYGECLAGLLRAKEKQGKIVDYHYLNEFIDDFKNGRRDVTHLLKLAKRFLEYGLVEERRICDEVLESFQPMNKSNVTLYLDYRLSQMISHQRSKDGDTANKILNDILMFAKQTDQSECAAILKKIRDFLIDHKFEDVNDNDSFTDFDWNESLFAKIMMVMELENELEYPANLEGLKNNFMENRCYELAEKTCRALITFKKDECTAQNYIDLGKAISLQLNGARCFEVVECYLLAYKIEQEKSSLLIVIREITELLVLVELANHYNKYHVKSGLMEALGSLHGRGLSGVNDFYLCCYAFKSVHPVELQFLKTVCDYLINPNSFINVEYENGLIDDDVSEWKGFTQEKNCRKQLIALQQHLSDQINMPDDIVQLKEVIVTLTRENKELGNKVRLLEEKNLKRSREETGQYEGTLFSSKKYKADDAQSLGANMDVNNSP